MSIVCICMCVLFCFFKQKTAYGMRISDWSSDVCSSDLLALAKKGGKAEEVQVAESAVGTAKQRAQVSAQQAQRLATAFKHNSVTAQEYERARGLPEVDRKTLAEMQSKLELIRSGADAERIAALEAQMREAAETLADRQKQLTYNETTDR